MTARAAFLVVCCAGGAAAGGAGAEVPPPEYFAGIYERVGRTAGPEAGLIDDLVRIAPDPGGAGMLMQVCLPEGAPGAAPLALRFDAMGEVDNLLTAGEGEGTLYCQFFNDAGNYAILACQTEVGAKFTLWAAPDRGPDCP